MQGKTGKTRHSGRVDLSVSARAKSRPPRKATGVSVAQPTPQLREGPEVDRALAALSARGAAYRDEIYIASHLAPDERAAVIAHETTHARQTGAEAHGPPRGIGGSATQEREAMIASAIGAPLEPRRTDADPGLMRLYNENQLLFGSISPAWADALTPQERQQAINALRDHIRLLTPGSHEHRSAMDNHAVLEQSVRREPREGVETTSALPPPPAPVDLHLDRSRPWIARIETPDATARDVSYELYGIDVSPVMQHERYPSMETFNDIADVFDVDLGLPTVGSDYEVTPGLLRHTYRADFHKIMGARLKRDVAAAIEALDTVFVTDERRQTAMDLVDWWSKRGNLMQESGESYFDAFLSALNSRHREGAFGPDDDSFLDRLFAWQSVLPDDDSGTLITQIAENSTTYGTFTPFGAEEGADPTNPRLVNRARDLILDRVEGVTGANQSRAIREILMGLPPAAQAATLQGVMNAHDDLSLEFFTILGEPVGIGRHGEPTPSHMLFNLFENLDEEAGPVIDQMVERGILQPDLAKALRSGRSWGGRLLPVTTYWGERGQQAAQAAYEETGNRTYAVLGGLAGLWTPDTALETAATLIMFRHGGLIGRGMSRLPAGAQAFLAGAGGTMMLANLASNIHQAATGEGPNDTQLNASQRVTRGIYVIFDLYSIYDMVKGFRAGGAGHASPNGAHLAIPDAPAPRAGPGNGVNFGYRVFPADADGMVMAVARGPNGEMVVARVNAQTGNGILVAPDGTTMPISGFQLDAPFAGLLAPEVPVPTAAAREVVPTSPGARPDPEVATPGGASPGRNSAFEITPDGTVVVVPGPSAGRLDIPSQGPLPFDITPPAPGTTTVDILPPDLRLPSGPGGTAPPVSGSGFVLPPDFVLPATPNTTSLIRPPLALPAPRLELPPSLRAPTDAVSVPYTDASGLPDFLRRPHALWADDALGPHALGPASDVTPVLPDYPGPAGLGPHLALPAAPRHVAPRPRNPNPSQEWAMSHQAPNGQSYYDLTHDLAGNYWWHRQGDRIRLARRKGAPDLPADRAHMLSPFLARGRQVERTPFQSTTWDDAFGELRGAHPSFASMTDVLMAPPYNIAQADIVEVMGRTPAMRPRGAPSGATMESVRGATKLYLVERILMPRLTRLPRDASLRELERIARHLSPADYGALGERWHDFFFRGPGRIGPAAEIQLRQPPVRGGGRSDMYEDYRLDEVKAVRQAMGPEEAARFQRQLDEVADSTMGPKLGGADTADMTFLFSEGARNNIDFMAARFEQNAGREVNLRFRILNHHGEARVFTQEWYQAHGRDGFEVAIELFLSRAQPAH